MQSVGARQLKIWLDTPDVQLQLLDVREAWEYEVCHLEGALHIPMGQITTQLHQLDRGLPTVVVCHHGVRSAQVAMFLDRQGFQTINLHGGIDAWAREVDTGMTLY
ncbi:MAG: rhodanese-like domain-containing protein [Gammaproteobacteria bacterium]|nr:rhodanese-like domain-containing protein [Gammaproteobacteria bacterium]